jgi:hypothetical protein
MCISLFRLDIVRFARLTRAVPAEGTCVSGVNGVSGIQPQHVGEVVIPQGHDEDDTSINSLLDGIHAALRQEIGAILGVCNPVGAELIGDGVVGLAVDGVSRVLNDLAILLVELLHFGKFAMVGSISSDELRSHGDWLGAVNLELGSSTKEIVDTQPVGLNVTSILVAQAVETVVALIVAAILTFAASLRTTLA